MSQDLSLPTTSFALLGLLTFGDELTGYELKQRADNTLRFYWVAPAMSQIYSELTRLTSHGLVEPTTSAGEGRRTTTYRITVHGRAALSDWVAESRVGFPVLKHTVLLRLSYADAAQVAELIRRLALTKRGQVEVDARTNSIIITDVAEALSRSRAVALSSDRP